MAEALLGKNPTVVWATERHREGLRQGLQEKGVDVDAAIRGGLYLASDISDPADEGRIIETFTCLREAAIRGGNEQPRIAVCGERAGRMWGGGQTDAALDLERCLNRLAKTHDLEILCVYPLPTSQQDESAFDTICEVHSAASFE